ncbi:MAG TPA: tRNA (adenosine(37)-N6)-threonylcarbamoyltransferase complex ATPase subunit type 1 TsaE [Bacteroidales bacterium]|nr:tRNA (adenosine(37)-N6)-threonylcarbamoyltransferase complex ATPase subunit type 1 TsaE [Bacteroidales bacterium]HPS17133.1 tRNA (adenosine(37)-N6)-threonylcarbamoyltransferase complex ATPase subunit type 1 TsaE [Bacteroidales bacterium]
MEIICVHISDLPGIAEKLIKKHPQSRIFAFFGKMGVGKTTFIKELCKALKVKDITNSPSFGIINEYFTETNDPVYHFDFYRIKNSTEFFDIGCEEYLYSGHYCFIEWPEKIIDLLPENSIIIHIEESNGKRIFRF